MTASRGATRYHRPCLVTPSTASAAGWKPVHRPLAGAALHAEARRLPPAGRLLPDRAARGDPRRGRAGRGRPRGPDLRRRANLILAGERRRPRCTGRVYQQMEIDYGRFTRQIALPADIDVEAAKATYNHGVLTIVLPLAKKPVSIERVEIHIRSAHDRPDGRADRRRRPRAPVTAAGPAPKGHRRLPRPGAPTRDRAGRSVRLVEDVVSGNRLIALVASRTASSSNRAGTTSTRSARRQSCRR